MQVLGWPFEWYTRSGAGDKEIHPRGVFFLGVFFFQIEGARRGMNNFDCDFGILKPSMYYTIRKSCACSSLLGERVI